MKTLFNFKRMTTTLLMSFIIVSLAFSQSRDTTWSIHGNHTDTTCFIGNTAYQDVKIITDSTIRITVTKDGDVNIDKNLIIGQKIQTDSIISTSEEGLFLNSIVTPTITSPNLYTDQIHSNTSDSILFPAGLPQETRRYSMLQCTSCCNTFQTILFMNTSFTCFNALIDGGFRKGNPPATEHFKIHNFAYQF